MKITINGSKVEVYYSLNCSLVIVVCLKPWSSATLLALASTMVNNFKENRPEPIILSCDIAPLPTKHLNFSHYVDGLTKFPKPNSYSLKIIPAKICITQIFITTI